MLTLRPLLKVLLLLCCAISLGQTKKPLTDADIAKWEFLGAYELSPSGDWLSFPVNTVDVDGRTELWNLNSKTKRVFANGTAGRFSENGKWYGVSINPSKAETEKIRANKGRVEPKLEVLELAADRVHQFSAVQSWRFIKKSDMLLVHLLRAEKAEKGGSDLLVFDLITGKSTTFGNVAAYSFNTAGTHVSLLLESATGDEAIQILNLSSLSLKQISASKSDFGAPVWAKNSDRMMFTTTLKNDKKEGENISVTIVADATSASPKLIEFDPSKHSSMPAGYRVLPGMSPQVTDDMSSVSFVIQKWKDKRENRPKPEDVPGVEVWNSDDVDMITVQKVQQFQRARRGITTVWKPDTDTFSVIGNEVWWDLTLSKNHQHALVFDGDAHGTPVKTNGLEYERVHLVDVSTGKSRVFADKVVSNVFGIGASAIRLSPSGKYLTSFVKGEWLAYEIATGKTIQLTSGIKDEFRDMEDDHVVPEKPAYRSPDFLHEDEAVLLYSESAVYLFDFSKQTVTKVTTGAPGKLKYFYVPVGDRENRQKSTDRLIFTALDRVTKETQLCVYANGAFKSVSQGNFNLGGFTAAKEGDRFLYTISNFMNPAKILVSDLNLATANPLTQINAQQQEFQWGKTELVQYKVYGQQLQGTLYYPAGYVPGKKYPMITYIYERQSDGFNQYISPSLTSPYNAQNFSQSGYFFFMPDIIYLPPNPGLSSVQCIETAVQAAMKSCPDIDGEKLGLMGHSHGGYQTTFAATQSKMFKGYVAGAPVTDLYSMYNSIYWNSGYTCQVYYESSQGRMGVPWWEDDKSYRANSPLQNAKNITQPLLVAFGTKDGAVDWFQGQIMYNTLRRMGKKTVLLVYEGENHGLAKKPNQLDYKARVAHFWDVYLKGVKPEPWLEKGIPYLDHPEVLEKSVVKPPQK